MKKHFPHYFHSTTIYQPGYSDINRCNCITIQVSKDMNRYVMKSCACVCLCVGYFKENILLHFIASMISGLITTAASMPVDIAKTRFDSALGD